MQGQHTVENGTGRYDGLDTGGVAHNGHGGAVAGTKVALRTGGQIAGIVPTSIEEVFRLATAIAASGLAPRDMSTPEKLTVAILHGLEIGIPPMMSINKIAIVNGRPTLWGDAIPALLLSRNFRLREEIGTGPGGRFAECTVVRPNGEVVTRQFSEGDAKVAGLWGKQGPWKQYPDRMLQMRARGLAARDGAADVLSGIYLAEEAQDIDVREPSRDLLPAPPATDVKRKSSAQAKRDGDGELLEHIRTQIADAETIEQLHAVRAEYDTAWLNMPYSWAQILEAEYQDRLQEFHSAQSAE